MRRRWSASCPRCPTRCPLSAPLRPPQDSATTLSPPVDNVDRHRESVLADAFVAVVVAPVGAGGRCGGDITIGRMNVLTSNRFLCGVSSALRLHEKTIIFHAENAGKRRIDASRMGVFGRKRRLEGRAGERRTWAGPIQTRKRDIRSIAGEYCSGLRPDVSADFPCCCESIEECLKIRPRPTALPFALYSCSLEQERAARRVLPLYVLQTLCLTRLLESAEVEIHLNVLDRPGYYPHVCGRHVDEGRETQRVTHGRHIIGTLAGARLSCKPVGKRAVRACPNGWLTVSQQHGCQRGNKGRHIHDRRW